MMKRLLSWIVFELVATAISILLMIGCAVGLEKLLTSLNYSNPIVLVLQGTGVVLLAAFAFGLFLEMGFVFILFMEVNPEIYLEEKQNKINR